MNAVDVCPKASTPHMGILLSLFLKSSLRVDAPHGDWFASVWNCGFDCMLLMPESIIAVAAPSMSNTTSMCAD